MDDDRLFLANKIATKLTPSHFPFQDSSFAQPSIPLQRNALLLYW